MNKCNRIFICAILIFIISNCTIHSQQIISYGLEGKVVNDIKYYSGYLFAATDSGAYRMSSGSSEWVHIGLENKKVNVVYPHDFGPVGWTVSAGVSPTFTPGDSALIYCNCDTNWVIADSGIDRSEISNIMSLGGFPSPVICGETFAGGGGKIFRRGIGTWYKQVYDTNNPYKFNVVKTDLNNGNVWIGGETGFFQAFIAKSTDLGDTWNTSLFDLGGDNACNSLEFVKSDTNTIVYAGMEGLVIKSTDGGTSWDSTGLINTPYYFFGLSYDSFHNILYAGGSTNDNNFGLFASKDKGTTWTEIQTGNSYKGISSMVLVPAMVPEVYNLFIATFGDGVLLMGSELSVGGNENNLLEKFELKQNYPNPFNPTTNIEFRIAEGGLVTLKVYDDLGREIATLVNEEKPAGEYEVEFDAGNLTSGIYFYTITAGKFHQTKKMILLR